MKQKKYFIFSLLAAFSSLFSSCIENDIPYPYIELYITKVEGEGFTQKAISNSKREVSLTLDETTDIQDVKITNWEFSEGAEYTQNLVGEHDMRVPILTTLYQYQRYDWKVTAEQEIERYFRVEGQIGLERIDVEALKVEVDVNQNGFDNKNVKVLEMKLGPREISAYSHQVEDLTDFSGEDGARIVDVVAHGRTEEWIIQIIPIAPQVSLEVDLWAEVAWLRASGDVSQATDYGFRYRLAGEVEWKQVTAQNTGGGEFSSLLEGLEAERDYEFMAYIDQMQSPEMSGTSESKLSLPNGDFEEWHEENSVWNPWSLDASPWWGTGNKGSRIGGKNVTNQDTAELRPATEGLSSARLNSENVVIKFAAGNIFVGSFYQVYGTNGAITFGRPFTSRPFGLKGWMKYDCGKVTHNDKSEKLQKGENDNGSIYIALGEWTPEEHGRNADGEVVGTADSPFVVDTRSEATFFDPLDSAVIAYGELILTDSSDGWQEFTIDLEYRDKQNEDGSITRGISRRPTHIMVVASSSRYGDYFTGSSESTMWLDDLELLYSK